MGTQLFCNSPPACKLATTCSGGTCTYSQSVANGTPDPKCPAATPNCFAGACVQCAMDTQCVSTVTPSCSPTSHTCVCRRPSAGNRLTNSGFDGSFTGWTVFTATLGADSEGCPGSNSAFIENSEEDPFQCITLPAGAFFLGGKFKGGFGGNFIRMRLFDGANCTGNGDTVQDMPVGGFVDWTTIFVSSVAPPGTVSAGVGFLGLQQFLDQLYVNASNQF